MIQIANLTADSIQSFQIKTEDSFTFFLKFEFIESQNTWYFSLTYGDFEINRKALRNNLQLLSAYQSSLPFGLACTVLDDGEPYFLDDFESGRVQLYVLSKTEVEELKLNLNSTNNS